MKLPNKKLMLPLALILLLVLGGRKLYAQTVRTVTISPPTIETSLNPGGSTQGQLKVINDSDEAITFNAQARDFVVNDTIGTPELLPVNSLSNKYSGASWIGVDPSTFTVAPHEKALIDYFIQVPQDARPGGHYAAMVYAPTSEGALQGSGASVNAQIGTLFYVTVNGNVNENASVIEFLAKKFQEYGPVSITSLIQNSGDIHERPQGQIAIYNFLGQKSDTKALDQHNIFPGAARRFDNSLGSKFMFGPYTAKLTGSYGKSDNLPLTASLSFFVFPWKVATLIVLIIIAVILGILYFKKRSKKTKDTPVDTKTTPQPPQGPTVIS